MNDNLDFPPITSPAQSIVPQTPDDIRETLATLDFDFPALAAMYRHVIARLERLEQRA